MMAVALFNITYLDSHQLSWVSVIVCKMHSYVMTVTVRESKKASS